MNYIDQSMPEIVDGGRGESAWGEGLLWMVEV